jgi:hypothetical protein
VKRVGRYEVLGGLGRGGAGAVLRVRDPESGEELALKRLEVTSELSTKRFEREAQALARLDHPHVVRVHEFGSESGRPHLVMELVEGTTLEARLSRGPLPPREAARLVAAVADAVAHAHAHNVLHRDLKPDNVLLANDGNPKLTDFGLTRDVLPRASQTRLSQDGVILGTPNYWAPEQARGEAKGCGTHTDVYGLGALLYATLTGRPPHEGNSLLELAANAQRPPTPPTQHVPGIPRALEAICLQSLQLDPADRLPSAHDLAQELRAYLAGDAPPQTAPASRRGALALAVCVLGLATAAAILLWPATPAPTHAPADPEQATPSAAPDPSPATSPPGANALRLDADALLNTYRFPALEAREPWGIDAADGVIRFRAHPRAKPELRLPLHLDGSAFEVEALLRLDSLEPNNAFCLLLQGERPGGDLRVGLALASDGQELYAIRAQVLAWRERGRVERAPTLLDTLQADEPLTCRLRYTPDDGLVVSVRHGEAPALSAQVASSAELSRGRYWLRLGANLDPDLEWGRIGSRGHDQAALLNARVERLDLDLPPMAIRAAEGLHTGRLNVTGQAGRQLIASADMPDLIETLRGLVLTEETGLTNPNLGAFLLLLPLAELQAGRWDDAAQSIRSARVLTGMTGPGEAPSDPGHRWRNAWTSAWPLLEPDERRLFAGVEVSEQGYGAPERALEEALARIDTARDGVRRAALLDALFVQAGELANDHAEQQGRAAFGCGALEQAHQAFLRAADRDPGLLLWAGVSAYRVGNMADATDAWEALGNAPIGTIHAEDEDLAITALSDLLTKAKARR